MRIRQTAPGAFRNEYLFQDPPDSSSSLRPAGTRRERSTRKSLSNSVIPDWLGIAHDRGRARSERSEHPPQALSAQRGKIVEPDITAVAHYHGIRQPCAYGRCRQYDCGFLREAILMRSGTNNRHNQCGCHSAEAIHRAIKVQQTFKGSIVLVDATHPGRCSLIP